MSPGLVKLPPLNRLRIFEVAARHLSFVHAAQELSLSNGAISQAVATLERELGVQLFVRQPRQVSLTPAGARLAEATRRAQAEIRAAIEEITPGRRSLKISGPPTWVTRWLMPLLHEFTETNPDIGIDVEASTRLVDLDVEPVDLAIRYAHKVPSHYGKMPLFEQRLIPVCSKQLAANLAHPNDLRNVRLLHELSPDRWESWIKFALAGEPALGFNEDGGLFFNQGNLAMEAAVKGQGVALAEPAMAASYIKAGELVQPFPIAWLTGNTWHATWSERRIGHPAVPLFVGWLKACAEREALA